MNALDKIGGQADVAPAPEVATASDVAQLFINGAWRAAEGGRTFIDINPTTRQKFAQVADGSVADMDAAIAAARDAQPAWEALPPAARATLLHKAASIFEANQEKFVKALVHETGSGFGKAMFECSLIPLALREAAGLTTQPSGEIYPSNVP